MEVTKAIRSRSSIRGFKPDPVPRKVLEEILEICRWAPSSRNMQTWEIAIIGGKIMAEVKARLAEKAKAQVKPNPDLPEIEPTGIHLQRALDAMHCVDAHQFPPGTENLDAKRGAYFVRGEMFFDAPNGIIIYTDKALAHLGAINAGIMAHTISLVAPTYGLGTCIMLRATHYPDIIRGLLGISDSKNIIIGVAIGYPDPDALVNSCPRSRLPLKDFAQWHGF